MKITEILTFVLEAGKQLERSSNRAAVAAEELRKFKTETSTKQVVADQLIYAQDIAVENSKRAAEADRRRAERDRNSPTRDRFNVSKS